MRRDDPRGLYEIDGMIQGLKDGRLIDKKHLQAYDINAADTNKYVRDKYES
jgi:hypothetical protein